MQLKHVPLCLLLLGSICLAGAVTSARADGARGPAVAEASELTPVAS